MSEIIMFGRELTGEQIKGFVSCEEKDGEIRMPSKWVAELCDNRTELETLRSENTLLSERVKELDHIVESDQFQYQALCDKYYAVKKELSALKESKTVYVRRCK